MIRAPSHSSSTRLPVTIIAVGLVTMLLGILFTLIPLPFNIYESRSQYGILKPKTPSAFRDQAPIGPGQSLTISFYHGVDKSMPPELFVPGAIIGADGGGWTQTQTTTATTTQGAAPGTTPAGGLTPGTLWENGGLQIILDTKSVWYAPGEIKIETCKPYRVPDTASALDFGIIFGIFQYTKSTGGSLDPDAGSAYAYWAWDVDWGQIVNCPASLEGTYRGGTVNVDVSNVQVKNLGTSSHSFKVALTPPWARPPPSGTGQSDVTVWSGSIAAGTTITLPKFTLSGSAAGTTSWSLSLWNGVGSRPDQVVTIQLNLKRYEYWSYVSGKVVDEFSKTAVPNTLITVRQGSYPTGDVVGKGESAADGTFKVKCTSYGPLYVDLNHPKYMPSKMYTVDAPDHGEVSLGVVEIHRMPSATRDCVGKLIKLDPTYSDDANRVPAGASIKVTATVQNKGSEKGKIKVQLWDVLAHREGAGEVGLLKQVEGEVAAGAQIILEWSGVMPSTDYHLQLDVVSDAGGGWVNTDAVPFTILGEKATATMTATTKTTFIVTPTTYTTTTEVGVPVQTTYTAPEVTTTYSVLSTSKTETTVTTDTTMGTTSKPPWEGPAPGEDTPVDPAAAAPQSRMISLLMMGLGGVLMVAGAALYFFGGKKLGM